MKTSICGVLAALCLVSTAPRLFASELTGTIVTFRLGSPDTANPDRVSIVLDVVNPMTSCTHQGWFAYDGAMSTSLGSLRTSSLLNAYLAGRRVRIVGTGTCDQYGVEQISYIDLE